MATMVAAMGVSSSRWRLCGKRGGPWSSSSAGAESSRSCGDAWKNADWRAGGAASWRRRQRVVASGGGGPWREEVCARVRSVKMTGEALWSGKNDDRVCVREMTKGVGLSKLWHRGARGFISGDEETPLAPSSPLLLLSEGGSESAVVLPAPQPRPIEASVARPWKHQATRYRLASAASSARPRRNGSIEIDGCAGYRSASEAPWPRSGSSRRVRPAACCCAPRPAGGNYGKRVASPEPWALHCQGASGRWRLRSAVWAPGHSPL